MLELFPRNTTFDFLGKRRFFLILSLILFLGSIYLWLAKGVDKYGTDFRGGVEFIVEVEKGTSEGVRDSLKDASFRDLNVYAFEAESHQYSVRLNAQDNGEVETLKKMVEEKLRAKFGEAKVVRYDFIGPVVGNELRNRALLAFVLSLVGLLIYVTYRFELSFAVGGVVAILHDVVIATGAYLAAGFPITMGTLAAALTIVGYSINDTIVIFDRVREDVEGAPKEKGLIDIINGSINHTLSRTLLTSLLTLLSTLTLFLVGGGTLSDLSFFLCVGIIVGSYSTIYIASPVALWWDKFWYRESSPVKVSDYIG
jgi:preprotein translocase subunit SecF